MTPTNKLRFVEREMIFTVSVGETHSGKVRVLQQWWEERVLTEGTICTYKINGEWSDVPLEAE